MLQSKRDDTRTGFVPGANGCGQGRMDFILKKLWHISFPLLESPTRKYAGGGDVRPWRK
jgi:hypothetical protein